MIDSEHVPTHAGLSMEENPMSRKHVDLECDSCGGNHHEDDCEADPVDECDHCGEEHDSDDCEMVDVYCGHCRESIENCGCEDEGLPELHITPAALKELDIKSPRPLAED